MTGKTYELLTYIWAGFTLAFVLFALTTLLTDHIKNQNNYGNRNK